jgi:hypothetical protein
VSVLTTSFRLTDVAAAISDHTTCSVHDLATLGVIVSNLNSPVPGAYSPRTSMFLQCLLSHLKYLSISLRLPLAAYEAMESAPVSSQPSPVSAWSDLPRAIARMGKLRRLNIWLDHDEACVWTAVNERAFLSPLAPLSNCPDLDVSINLPNLHPKWETPERHFTEDSDPFPLVIHRRCRQRQHSVKGREGGLELEDGVDFPLSYGMAAAEYELEEWSRECSDLPSVPYDAGEIELSQLRWYEWEKIEWKEGRDPAEIINAPWGCPPVCSLPNL